MIVFTKKDETLDIPQGLGNAQITLIEEAEHISRKEAQDMIDSAQWEAGAVTPSNVEKYVDSRLANLSTEMREWIEHTFVPREYVDGTFATKEELEALRKELEGDFVTADALEEVDRKYDERTNDLATLIDNKDKSYKERFDGIDEVLSKKVDNLKDVRGIMALTQAEYDALPKTDNDVLYVITCG